MGGDSRGWGEGLENTLLFTKQTVIYMYRYGSPIHKTDGLMLAPKDRILSWFHSPNIKWIIWESGCVNLAYRSGQFLNNFAILYLKLALQNIVINCKTLCSVTERISSSKNQRVLISFHSIPNHKYRICSQGCASSFI